MTCGSSAARRGVTAHGFDCRSKGALESDRVHQLGCCVCATAIVRLKTLVPQLLLPLASTAHAGQRLAADQPERPLAHRAVQPRSRLVGRGGRNVHLRRRIGCSNLRRGLLAEAGMTRLVRV